MNTTLNKVMVYIKNYEKLIKIVPDILEIKEYKKLKSGAFIDLSIDVLQDTPEYRIVALAHNSEQNGDLMADPDMQIKVYKNYRAIEALTYQNDYMGVFQEVYITRDGKQLVNTRLKKELNKFLGTWLTNLKKQGFISK